MTVVKSEAYGCSAVNEDLLTSMKALSDASRLRIVGLLAGGRAMSVADLAENLRLTPGTVVHHLKRLSEARLVESRPRAPYVDYSLRLERLAQIGAQLHTLSRSQDPVIDGSMDAPEWASPDQARVLRSFMKEGRLTGIPAQHGKRLVVLRHVAEMTFEPGVEYPEKEVNQRLALLHPDTASFRRYLVDEGFMSRERGLYTLLPRRNWPL